MLYKPPVTMKGDMRASTYGVFCVLTLLGMRTSSCKMTTTQMKRSDASFNSPVLLQCALQSFVGGFAGIQVNDITGECGALTTSDYRNGAHSANYHLQIALHRIYSEPPSVLIEDIPVPVNVGAQFELHIHQRHRYQVNLINTDSGYRMFQLECRPPKLVFNDYTGAWNYKILLYVDLSEDRIYVININVTIIGYEVYVDDNFMYTFAHRQSIAAIDRFLFENEASPQSTLSELSWNLPP